MPDPEMDDCHAQLDAARDKVQQLELALTSSRRIGAAVGIIMASRRCTEHDAFEVIRAHSQHVNVKVRVLAGRLIETGDTAGYPEVAGAPPSGRPET